MATRLYFGVHHSCLRGGTTPDTFEADALYVGRKGQFVESYHLRFMPVVTLYGSTEGRTSFPEGDIEWLADVFRRHDNPRDVAPCMTVRGSRHSIFSDACEAIRLSWKSDLDEPSPEPEDVEPVVPLIVASDAEVLSPF